MKPTSNDITELRGWIMPCDGADERLARKELESFGIDVGEWDNGEKEFRGCVVSLDALVKLDRTWTVKYIWGLTA